MEDIVNQINQLFRSANGVNFVMNFEADEINGCTTLDEALPRVKELYATPTDPQYPQGIKYVHQSTVEDMWQRIDQAFAFRGDYDNSVGVRMSDEQEAKLSELQKRYRAIVESYMQPDTTVYGFTSSRSTYDLFGFMILNKNGKSFAILAENSD